MTLKSFGNDDIVILGNDGQGKAGMTGGKSHRVIFIKEIRQTIKERGE